MYTQICEQNQALLRNNCNANLKALAWDRFITTSTNVVLFSSNSRVLSFMPNLKADCSCICLLRMQSEWSCVCQLNVLDTKWTTSPSKQIFLSCMECCTELILLLWNKFILLAWNTVFGLEKFVPFPNCIFKDFNSSSINSELRKKKMNKCFLPFLPSGWVGCEKKEYFSWICYKWKIDLVLEFSKS